MLLLNLESFKVVELVTLARAKLKYYKSKRLQNWKKSKTEY